MSKEHENIINCSTFEELLTDYLDKTLGGSANSSVASHALACPLCHSLLNDVKESLQVCRNLTAPSAPITRLEARVLSMTMPQTAMPCENFEEHLTDYLDGFLPATDFHRWERHAALCSGCEDLPGMVVRSIAACYTYKSDELAVPAGLHQRIINLTLHAKQPLSVNSVWTKRAAEWVSDLRFPIAVPQIAPVAMMLMFAFMFFSQSVSADGSLAGIYQRSVELAGMTYQQGADAFGGKPADEGQQDPITGTTPVNHEEK